MKNIIAVALVAGLGLAGCNTIVPTPSPTTTTTVVTNTTTIVDNVVAAAVTACGFVPAATTIAQILNASSGVMTATQIASVICSAVTKQPVPAPTTTSVSRHYKVGPDVLPSTVEVNGQVVVVRGNFVVGHKH